MPAYQPGTTGVPLQAIYPGGIGAPVWAAEAPAAGTKSLAVAVARVWDSSTQAISVEIVFNQLPGAYEIDVQDSDTDVDGDYVSLTGAAIITTSALVVRAEFSPWRGKFVRLLMKTIPANGGTTLSAKITQ